MKKLRKAMVVKRYMLLCLTMAWTCVASGFGSTDIETPEKVEAYKAELKTQSVEQLNTLFEAMLRSDRMKDLPVDEQVFVSGARNLPTWKKWMSIEELVTRKPNPLDELERIDKELSKRIYDGESIKLRAKIAVDVIRRTCKTESEQVATLGKVLDSTSRGNYFNAEEASRELSRIGTSSAREMLIAKEAKWPIMTRTARLGMEIMKLDLAAAVDLLLDSAYQDLNTPEIAGVGKLVAEKSLFQGLNRKDAKVVLSQVVRRQTQLQGKNKQQSAADKRYNDFLQELRSSAEKSIKEKEIHDKKPIGDPKQNVQKRDSLSNMPPVSASGTVAKTIEPIASSQSAQKSFTRPEERGEDFSQRDSTALIEMLSTSKEKVTLKKAAKALGDRSALGALTLTESEKVAMTNIVQSCLQKMASADANEHEEGRVLIESLWRTAVPGLLNNIANEKPSIREASLKSLSLMKDEQLIRSLMALAKQSTHAPTRMMAIFALGNMTEKRSSLIPGRTPMDEAACREVVEKQVRPFLLQLLATEKNAEMKSLLERALKTLDEAPDRRLIRVPNK